LRRGLPYLALLMVLLLGAAEFSARLAQSWLERSVPAYYYRQYFSALIESNPVLVWSGRPGAKAEITNSKGEKIEYRMNGLGWRGPEFTPLSQPANALVLGDSFSFGTGVREQAVYSRVLEESFSNLHVWNLAQMGYAPDQHLLLAQRWLTAFPWRFLVVQLANNDVADVAGHIWVNPNSASGIPSAIEPPASHAWFSGFSEAWNLFAFWRLHAQERALSEAELSKGLERLLFSLRHTFALAKERGVPVVILQASDWGELAYGEKISAAYQDGVRALSSEFKAPLVEMRGAELLPIPDLHWTENAHKNAAENVLLALKSLSPKL